VIGELQKQLYDKSDYIQRLEKRNAELEKQIIDTQSRLKEAEARIGYKDGRIRELETKCEGLDKIRKDIINTVSAISPTRAEQEPP
jgi:septal ring factor EnvC (AmiA/AmiB activator)